uniref:Uncharacterized protein n=1 Tax=Mus musculus TaxID=10090 RepID=Q8C1U6_MOUSE|nr:unnamed protein product [Mus musculus]
MCCFLSQQAFQKMGTNQIKEFFGQISHRLPCIPSYFIFPFFLIFPVWPGSYKQLLSWPDGQSPGPQFQQNPVLKVPLSAFLPEANTLCLSFFLQTLLLLAQETAPSPAHV